MGDNLAAYLPHDRRAALAHGTILPSHARGTALFADIAGFTTLTELLACEHGTQRGAEELTATLNQVYEALIAEVERYGGSVIGFSGDAITCWFDQNSAAQRAATCALAMQQAIGGCSSIGVALKVALASGDVRRVVIGDRQIHLRDLLVGPLVDRLAAIAALATRGETLIDCESALALGALLVPGGERVGSDGTRALCIRGLTATATPLAPIALAVLTPEQLRPWIAPAVYSVLEHTPAAFVAALRPAVALMLRFGAADSADTGALDGYIRWAQQIIATYEGVLIDVTMGDHGNFFYAAFGAPVAHADDAARAIAAALALLQPPSALAFAQARIGLAAGVMRIGAYGSVSRRTYGVLGDRTNLAARLMDSAPPGAIWCDDAVHDQAQAQWAFRTLPPVAVKGKAAPIAVFQPTGAAVTSATTGVQHALIGRNAELAQLQASLAAAMHGVGQAVVIDGEAGIGKSRLIAALATHARAAGVDVLLGAGQSIAHQTAYHSWRRAFSAFFVHPGDSHDQTRQQVRERVARLLPMHMDAAPLLNELLPLDLPETTLTRALDARQRSDMLAELLSNLIGAWAAEQPLLLVIEDAHWLDSRSWELVVRVAQMLRGAGGGGQGAEAKLPVSSALLVVTTRPQARDQARAADIASLLRIQRVSHMRLIGLAAADTSALAAAWLGVDVAALPAALVALLHDRCTGNPLFAEELVAALREQGWLRVEPAGTGPAAPLHVFVSDLEHARSHLPATLQGLLLARLDWLPPEHQLTLKVASVIGTTFDYGTLHHARGLQAVTAPDALKQQLRTLAAQDFTALESPDPDLAYRFRHVLAQDAVYQTLLYAQRRQLHQAVAEWYEAAATAPASVAGETRYPLLAHHYRYAELHGRERQYAFLAGVQAANQFANSEALAFFTRALELTPVADTARRYQVLLAREQVNDILGDRVAQQADLHALEALAAQLGPNQQLAVGLRRTSYAEATSDFAAAVRAAEAVVVLALTIDATAGAAAGYLRWGAALLNLGDFAGAQMRLDQAQQLAQLARLDEITAESQLQLGVVAERQGKYAAALAFGMAALHLYQQLGQRRDEALVLNNLGAVSGYQNNLDAARSYFEQAQAVYQSLGDRRGTARTLLNLSNIASAQADTITTNNALDEALRLYEAVGDRRGMALALLNLGISHEEGGDFAVAHDLYTHGLSIAREIGDRFVESFLLALLASIALETERYAEAQPLAQAALQLARELDAGARVARCLVYLGDALWGQQQAAAEQAYREALRLAEQLGMPPVVRLAHAGLAAIALVQGAHAAALASAEAITVSLAAQADADDGVDGLPVFLVCYHVFQAHGDQRAAALLTQGHAQLQRYAGRISDLALRHGFLAVPARRDLVRLVGQSELPNG